MRKITYFLLLVFGKTFCQIPNSGFENWTNFGSYEDANGWISHNATAAFQGIFPCVKVSPGQTGNYCVSLVTNTYMPSGSMAGIIFSGQPILPTSPSGQKFRGFPHTTRPLTLDGFCMHRSPLSNSNCQITVYATKWNPNNNSRDTICYMTSVFSGTVNSWTPFSINLSAGYKSMNNPDSCLITMKSNINTFNLSSSIGDFLTVDNLSFNGIMTSISEIKNKDIVYVYPNPASQEINVISNNNNLSEILILDNFGKLILKTDRTTIDISNLCKGIYVLKITDTKNSVWKKLIIE